MSFLFSVTWLHMAALISAMRPRHADSGTFASSNASRRMPISVLPCAMTPSRLSGRPAKDARTFKNAK